VEGVGLDDYKRSYMLTKDQKLVLLQDLTSLIENCCHDHAYDQEDPIHLAELIVKIAPAKRLQDMILEMRAHQKYRAPYPIPYAERAPGQWRPERFR
jgi:hypothetical protein